MNLKRIAEELDTLADAESDKELDQALVACGLTAEEDEVVEDEAVEDEAEDIFADDEVVEDVELEASVKTAAEKDQFEVAGVNSEDQDEFDQVVGVTENGGGQEDYSSVADAAKKLASAARRLATVKAEIVKRGEVKKYASKVVAMEKAIERKAEQIRIAVADKTPFAGDLGKTLPVEKEYGAYDSSEEAMNAEIQSKSAPWKGDKHDEAGFGIPKQESEVTREASVRLAANKAVRLAVCLLGNKAPEDVITAQGRDFFASLDASTIERALKRYAETSDLYEKQEEMVAAPKVEDVPVVEAPVVEAKVEAPVTETCAATQEVKNESSETPVVGEVKTVEQAANEISATVEVAAVAELPEDAPFTKEEEAKIASFVKARMAKMMQEAQKRIAADEAVSPVVPVEAPEKAETPDEVKEASTEEVPAVVEEAPAVVEDQISDDEIEISGGINEADAISDPELEAAFDEQINPQQVVTASKTEKAEKKTVQKLGFQKLASAKEGDELSQCWANPDEDFFSK